jgi:hypothetical protein
VTAVDNADDVAGGYTDAKGGLHGFVRRASGVLSRAQTAAKARIASAGTV